MVFLFCDEEMFPDLCLGTGETYAFLMGEIPRAPSALNKDHWIEHAKIVNLY